MNTKDSLYIDKSEKNSTTMLCSTPEKKTDCPIRRFPRVGSQYQTRILNRPSETSSRPAPVKMSSDFPYKSDNERIEQQIHLESNGRCFFSNFLDCDGHGGRIILSFLFFNYNIHCIFAFLFLFQIDSTS